LHLVSRYLTPEGQYKRQDIQGYVNDAEELMEIILALFVLSSPPPRASELASMTLIDLGRPKSFKLCLIDPEHRIFQFSIFNFQFSIFNFHFSFTLSFPFFRIACIMSRIWYNKTNQLTGQDNMVTRFMPPMLSQLVYEYFARIVPMAATFCHHLGKEGVRQHLLTYAWVGVKGRLDGEDINEVVVRKLGVEGMNVGWADYRVKG
jgi:hypothetical protein